MMDIIPKKTERKIPLNNVLFFLAGGLLLAVILGYALLFRLEAAGLLSIQDFEENIFKIGAREDKIIENNLFNSEEKIKNFSGLWAGRKKTSQFFDNFEGLIHPRVWFSSLEFDPGKISAAAQGHAFNFEALEQQIIFLRSKSDLMESADLSGIAIGKGGGVDFGITINFTQKIFEAPEK